MLISPYFGGCKYTNNFLFINKNLVFQHFALLITLPASLLPGISRAPSRATSRAEQQIPQFFAQLRTKTGKTAENNTSCTKDSIKFCSALTRTIVLQKFLCKFVTGFIHFGRDVGND